jgi:hypothetical protein
MDGGYARRKTDGFSHPDNKENNIARWLIAMYDVTKKPVYRERSEKWWQLMKSRLKLREGGKYFVWNYWEPAGPWDYKGDGSTKHWVGVHPNGGYYVSPRKTSNVSSLRTAISCGTKGHRERPFSALTAASLTRDGKTRPEYCGRRWCPTTRPCGRFLWPTMIQVPGADWQPRLGFSGWHPRGAPNFTSGHLNSP